MAIPRTLLRRRLVRGALCALLGIAATVGISWAAEAADSRDWSRAFVPGSVWASAPPAGWPAAPIRTRAFGGFGVGGTVDCAALGTDRFYLTTMRSGLPFRAMSYTVACTVDDAGAGPLSYSGCWVVRRPGRTLGLPLTVIGPGFALDTVFYAALAYAAWSARGFVRSRIRTKRGACLVCGYDLQASAGAGPCPECGDGAP